MTKTVSQKMGIKEGVRAYFKNMPPATLAALELPSLEVKLKLIGHFDYIHLFTTTSAGLDEEFPHLKSHLGPTGMFWVSWPKNKQLSTDLSLPTVIRIGYNHGLVESTTLSVDSTWSAIKFTHPKKDKIYKNSYGRLPNT
jgi:hypothetical protein